MSAQSRETAASRSPVVIDFRATRSSVVKTSESHASLVSTMASSISMPTGPHVDTATTDAQCVWEQLKFNVPALFDRVGFPHADLLKLHSCIAVRPATLSVNAFRRTTRVASERRRISTLRIEANSSMSACVGVPKCSVRLLAAACGTYQIRTPGKTGAASNALTEISTSGPRTGALWVNFPGKENRRAIFAINADEHRRASPRAASDLL